MKRRSLGYATVGAVVLLVTAALGGETEQVSGGGCCGCGGTPSVLFLALDSLNGALAAGGYPSLPEALFLTGGGGYGGWVDGPRFGGFGGKGAVQASAGDRTARLALSYGGLVAEWGFAEDEGASLSLGAVLGGGEAVLSLVDHLPTSFADAVSVPFSSRLTRRFFAVQPYVGFQLPPVGPFSLRVNLGYLWTLCENWELGEADVPGPPESFHGPVVQLMVQLHPPGACPLFPPEEEQEEPGDV